VEILEKVPLKDWTFWKIGGPADYFCLPTSIDEVRDALTFARDKKIPFTVVGGGTNVLVSDAGVAGLVICMKKLVGVSSEERDGRLILEALAGSGKSELVKAFLKRKLAPALFLCGLPGDVGGGVVMNAGVAEMISPREFVEITDWIEVLHPGSLALKRFTRDEISWTYRHTEGWQPGLIVRAGISWPLVADADIPVRVKEATKNRLARQPLELPSCGSTFKNPDGGKAGALIEQVGLKGYTVGGAQVSPKHANFIVNLGGATAKDVRKIIAVIQSKVQQQTGFQLETEVKLLGRW
jgi:UDP-N-acetylmuramate dehydrogenase